MSMAGEGEGVRKSVGEEFWVVDTVMSKNKILNSSSIVHGGPYPGG